MARWWPCVLACLATRAATAEDWGAYAIVPASAPSLVLEAVGPGTAEGSAVSVNRPAGLPNQKWTLAPRGPDLYTIRPASAPTLVLAAAKGEAKPGTPIVLEADRGEPWQAWSLQKNDDGSYVLVPGHARSVGLDHFGGFPQPGARIDLWTLRSGDTHLEWIIRPLAGTTPAAGAGESPPSTYVPPEVRPEAVLPGRVEETTFAQSRVFPGTVRQVSVFIPAQYDGSRPACVSIKTDGYNAREKGLMEAMIASGEMPVTIGVFVRPGDLPSPVKGTIGRRNRCLEYDGVNDDNARFLLDELLPFVAGRYGLKLSDRGNDRCISGGSSGGIAAFVAAWTRPEAFARVYANSGSFVAFRGGHELPTLVRKAEPRPIRAYLTTGLRDMENCAGDWFLIDQEMDKALTFSGYDHRFRIINGGHVAGYYEYYREAMSYLWKDWPKPIEAGAGAPRVRDILRPGEPWKLVAEGRDNPRGPATNASGEVYFVEGDEGKIRRIDLDGRVDDPLPAAEPAEALSFGPGGELYAVSGRTGRVVCYGDRGRVRLVVDGLPGRHALAMPEGGLYVTAQGEGGEVWFVEDGKKTRVASGLKRAAGLAYRPDRWLLAVADGGSKWAYSYQIGEDGTLANGERFFQLHVDDWEDDAGAGSACYAREGQLLVATRSGIQACADDGPTQVILPLPDHARAVAACLGGRDGDTLYAFSAGKIWSRRVKVHGIGAFSPRAAVRGTPL